MLLPAFFAYAFTTAATLATRTLTFYLGLLTTLIPMGVAAASAGSLLVSHREQVLRGAALVVIVLGLVHAFAPALPSLGGRLRIGRGRGRTAAREPTSLVAVFALGASYGLAGVCTGPILGAVLTLAAIGSNGSMMYGAAVLAVYAAGMLTPVVVLAALWNRWQLGHARWLRPVPVRVGPLLTTRGNLIAGALFVVVGLVLALTDGTAALSGVLDVSRQQQLELWLSERTQQVPDLIAVLAIMGLIGAAIALGRDRASGQSRTED